MARIRLGAYLVERGLVREADVEAALGVQASMGGLLGLILVRLGALSENDLLSALSDQLGLPVQTRETMPSPDQVEAFIEESRTNSAWWSERQAIAWRVQHTPLEGEAVEVDP